MFILFLLACFVAADEPPIPTTTWAHVTHHYHVKTTDHFVAHFCSKFSDPSSALRAASSRIDIQCGNSWFNNDRHENIHHHHQQQLFVELRSHFVSVQLHLPHDHWDMLFGHHQGHPADCTLIFGGQIVSASFSRTRPSHQCKPADTANDNRNTATLSHFSPTAAKKEKEVKASITSSAESPTHKHKVALPPTFTMQRHMSPEQMTQLLDYLKYAAEAMVTHAQLNSNTTAVVADGLLPSKERMRSKTRSLLQVEDDVEKDDAKHQDVDGDVSTDSLLEVINSIDMASQLGVGIKMRTIFENIVNPITNAVAAQFPTIMFLLTKFPISIQMRDSIFESMKKMMTAPTLGNLDPNGPGAPSFLEESASGTNPGPAEVPGEGIGNTLGMQVADSVTVELSDALWKALKIKLEDSIANSVSRQTVRSLNFILTESLSHTVSRMIVEMTSKTLTRSMAKITNQMLIPSLTQSVGMTVTHALTRNPKSDYYCHYCIKNNLYCDLCRAETTENYNMDWNIAYYAKYYGSYFTYYYGNYFVDVTTDEYLKRGMREV